MRIVHVEVQNFRKLKSVRIDLNEATTLLVGANNSGKTSAMIALRHFLIDPGAITTNDFTLSNWSAINGIGSRWLVPDADGKTPSASIEEWEQVLPSLDVWLNVGDDEVHFVRHLIPTLDWEGGDLGVRLRFEPKDPAAVQLEYFLAVAAANSAKEMATKVDEKKRDFPLGLWPGCLVEFLSRRLRAHFAVRAYILDPAKQVLPVNGMTRPQALPKDTMALNGDPFDGLILIHEIAAHRELQDAWGGAAESGEQPVRRDRRKLSDQLRSYYQTHLDPSDDPQPADIEALQAIEDAQNAFDERLKVGFKSAIEELEKLNYPGVADPKLTISTRVRPLDGLNHQSAVRYQVACKRDASLDETVLRLPEDYNGLGFQNLISIVFRLMSFRDAWLKVGKASRRDTADESERVLHPPLHLVLIEEPEAHLHVQVQQVFVRKAYEVLRNHLDLKDNKALHSQMIVSTHSSHLAHECEFDCLRYFKRIRPERAGEVPTATVINLSEVFGAGDETARFVARYLRSTHCELFFADAAIIVEGQAERILVPHFIRHHYNRLHHRFITLLEVGGSHAHRFRTLIERLGLCTLLICDLDATNPTTKKAEIPERNAGQVTGNPTLLGWHPKLASVDALLQLTDPECELKLPDGRGSLRVAFQSPVQVNISETGAPVECLATTFEDALVFENRELVSQLEGVGMLKKIVGAVKSATDAKSLSQRLFDVLREGKKAELALDLLWEDKPKPLVEKLRPPTYITRGLDWLDEMLMPEEVVVTPIEQKAVG